MSEHTKEPLLIKHDEIGYISKSDDQSFGMFCPVVDIHNGKEESARRIVACVNRLAPFKTENIEDFGYDLFSEDRPKLYEAQQEIMHITNQRNELLAAIKEHFRLYPNDISHFMRTAISKAEAKS